MTRTNFTYQNTMRYFHIIILSALAMAFYSCSSPRYASTTEYDDVYYSSDDVTEPLARSTANNDYRENRGDNYYRNPEAYRENVNNYNEIYDDDDFYFSRRVRRFNQTNRNSWRYYDPYYSNDLYFVLGTNSWNSWNNNGWYSWNRPRFGAYTGWGNPPLWNDPFFNGFGTSGAWGWNAPSYYNPWVNAYYGYNPAYSNGFRNGFYSGYGYANYGAAYYCPPTGFQGWRSFNRATQNNRVTTATTRRRGTTQSNRSRTSYGNNRPTLNNTRPESKDLQARTANTSRSSNYLRPRTKAELETRTSAPLPNRTRMNNSTPSRNNGTVRPSTRSRNQARPSSSPSRTSPQMNRSNTQQRSKVRPNTSRPNRSNNGNLNRSRTQQPSYRPSSSPSRSRSNMNSSPRRSSTPSRSRTTSPSRRSGNNN